VIDNRRASDFGTSKGRKDKKETHRGERGTLRNIDMAHGSARGV